MNKARGIILATALTIAATTPAYAGEWFKDDNKWAYRDDSGQQIKEGWLTDVDGSVYNFSGGVIRQGPAEINGKHYFFGYSSGKRTAGIVNYNDATYFYNLGGVMQTGWLQFNGQWFYFNSDGKMVRNLLKEIGGEKFYFHTDGHMAANEWVSDGDYFAGVDGRIATAQWVDGQYLGSSGKVKDTSNDKDDDVSGKRKIDNKTFTAAEYADLARDSIDRYDDDVAIIRDKINEWREDYNDDHVYNYSGDDDDYIDNHELIEFEEDSTLDYIAALRAVELASCQRASGSRPDGRKMETLLTDNSIDATFCTESVAFGYDDGEDCYEELEDISTHTSIWKNVNYTHMGVGVACDADNRKYYVLVYTD